jgi:hypothetical protein
VNYFYNQEDRSTLPMCMAYSPSKYHQTLYEYTCRKLIYAIEPSSGKLLAIGTEEGVISILDTRQTATQRGKSYECTHTQ